MPTARDQGTTVRLDKKMARMVLTEQDRAGFLAALRDPPAPTKRFIEGARRFLALQEKDRRAE